jgi:hypothetical protein
MLHTNFFDMTQFVRETAAPSCEEQREEKRKEEKKHQSAVVNAASAC